MGSSVGWVCVGAVAAVMCTPVAAVAQEPPAAPGITATGLKSEGSAFRWSLFGTMAPIAVGVALAASGPTDEGALASFLFIAGGVALGPSLGHFYADRTARAAATTLVRSGVILASLAISLSACPLEDCTEAEETTAAVSFLTGTAVATGLAIYDIATARASARTHNRRISMQPWIPRRGGIGLVATVEF